MAEPTMTPSACFAIFSACSGVEIPNPTAQGISFTSFTFLTIAPMSVVILERTPVTPSEDTQYTNPFASLAIIVIRSSEVGAIIEIKSTSYCLHTASNSSFSSNGISGKIMPSMPTS